MLNISRLKEGEIIKSLIDNQLCGIKKGDILEVVRVGYSRWDGMNYADCKTENGYLVEVMKNFADFEMV
jgi:hypothetical protein